ncbi:hypothetical protein [Alkalicoccus halolimnae]|uniref:Uncharacterized protein n=1 Tax=Alkalicoccus halolimnae TaxID=1667239 RepID=A0A5C7FJE7_9BACI|nr:hypothetical protein [Alkalicoccus halolimnae]TXF85546.1 hypothetical protein FTX54_08115 [Alkalicoccus halolimnae]
MVEITAGGRNTEGSGGIKSDSGRIKGRTVRKNKRSGTITIPVPLPQREMLRNGPLYREEVSVGEGRGNEKRETSYREGTAPWSGGTISDI